jgi:hypothetical protein
MLALLIHIKCHRVIDLYFVGNTSHYLKIRKKVFQKGNEICDLPVRNDPGDYVSAFSAFQRRIFRK